MQGTVDLEYWEKRPENLSREHLVRYLVSIDEEKEIFPDLSVRESDGGKYGLTGFKWVFKFTDTFKVMGRSLDIYMKGFFFEEGNSRGGVTPVNTLKYIFMERYYQILLDNLICDNII